VAHADQQHLRSECWYVAVFDDSSHPEHFNLVVNEIEVFGHAMLDVRLIFLAKSTPVLVRGLKTVHDAQCKSAN